jgi:hypothetical protein
MPESKMVYSAPRYQLIVGLSFAIPLLLVCALSCIALVTTGNFGGAVFFLLFTGFGGAILYHLGWRVSRRLELAGTTLRWRAPFRRGEVQIGQLRDVSQIGQRRNSSWKLDVADSRPIYLANSRTVGSFLAQVASAARAAGKQGAEA